jgi:hypothetical protein
MGKASSSQKKLNLNGPQGVLTLYRQHREITWNIKSENVDSEATVSHMKTVKWFKVSK